MDASDGSSDSDIRRSITSQRPSVSMSPSSNSNDTVPSLEEAGGDKGILGPMKSTFWAPCSVGADVFYALHWQDIVVSRDVIWLSASTGSATDETVVGISKAFSAGVVTSSGARTDAELLESSRRARWRPSGSGGSWFSGANSGMGSTKCTRERRRRKETPQAKATMYIEGITEFAQVLLATTKMTFTSGCLRIELILFCQLGRHHWWPSAGATGPSLSTPPIEPDP
ncbi:hypothetical protein VTN00DRAFT_3987 [Thermoascus crustaceus]|uniref:uncharacterized protein n=1 Tax=Thermoascus crustaceus TaxID=5088 RepID=UPI003742C87F